MLTALASALVVAVFVAPGALAKAPGGQTFDEAWLTAALRGAFVEYWNSGGRAFSPSMGTLVDYWFRFHVAKAAIAAILLAVLLALGLHVWRAFLRATDSSYGRQVALAASGVVVTACGLIASAMVMANLQGAVAPFSSLLSMLPFGETNSDLATALGQVREQLHASPTDRISPAAGAMISDFSRYHLAMAVIGAIVAVAFLATSVWLWRQFARMPLLEKRTRRVLASFGVFSALLALAAVVLVVANAGTAADSQPALAAFFDGGW
ncbi:hypothetical protein FOY51_09810 [Antrihabitans cavernicola]|uniref:Tat (Twin-arginine translocation) pathway signal sequence n=1 Tax=Antrihabitans cavernicola TaxID=2495913 RepID=A0A5A7SAI2_9NOCA|nr:hypothetical protein FOY51_09810 [Spelaeibacter cavernicola]